MKKLIITTLVLCMFSPANAQDLKSKKGENYLPEAGEWAIGFNIDNVFRYLGNSFNGNTNNAAPSLGHLNSGTFVGKKMIDEKSAYRIIVNFEYTNRTESRPELLDDELVLEDGNFKIFNLAVGAGKEWRRGKTRLQGFYGADALITLASGSYSGSVGNDIREEYESGLMFGGSVRAFLGAEYFIFPKMALGAQYTFGLNAEYRGKQTFGTNGEEIETNDSSAINIGGVGISSITLVLYF